MKPFFLDSGLHKFQICGYPGCEKDAKTEIVFNNAYSIGVCADSTHIAALEEIKRTYESTPSIKVFKKLNIEELFFFPKEMEGKKCKYLQWTKRDETPPPQKEKPPTPKPVKLASSPIKESPPVKIVEGWKWVTNFGRWMTVEGRVVQLSTLPTDELTRSIIMIRDLNFGRVTARIAWTKEIISRVAYQYPENELTVGSNVAGEKLEEFKEAAEERGLL